MNKPITQHVLNGCSEQNLHSHRPAVPPSLFLLLFTNTLQSHGRVMAGAPPLPLSSAVAKIQGVSYFDNSMLTQVRAEIFQLKKTKQKKKKRPSVLVGLQAGTGFYILSQRCSCVVH